MNKLRIGVIGVGSMGSNHLEYISNTENVILTCVCDIDKDRADYVAKKYKVKAFYNYKELINSSLVDAVLIATPHYSHTLITIDAFKAGLHVLTEKPIAVHIADAEEMIDAHKGHPQLKWGAMFQQRIMEIHQKLKQILDSKEFGEIQRINYTITDWFRTQSYYDSSSWRATWHGEGGGVLLNQSVHQLDLFQWFFGMPNKIKAFCGFGKYHNIEVEDEVTSYFEYDNSSTAVLIISSGETPGINRLEIVADKGKIILEKNKITIMKNICSASKFILDSTDAYATPESIKNEFTFPKEQYSLHQKTIENFANSILKKTPLLANGEEGLKSLMLANSILYSSLIDKTVSLPLDSKLYNDKLKELVSKSKFTKTLNTNLNFRNFKPPYAQTMNKFTILKAKHLKLGRQGERTACRFLRNKSYDILMRNYKVKRGEIDIIARDGSIVCFVEVKTRKYSKEKIRNTKTLLSFKQSKRIRNASKHYLFELGNPKVVFRYELIEIFFKNYRINTIYHWQHDFGK